MSGWCAEVVSILVERVEQFWCPPSGSLLGFVLLQEGVVGPNAFQGETGDSKYGEDISVGGQFAWLVCDFQVELF